MKINLVSDLHLDISKHLELPGGEVLIVAGDAFESRDYIREYHSTHIIGERRTPCTDFFIDQCAKYDKVFYVLGNHEFYNGKTWKVANELRQVLPKNVTLLDDSKEEYNGVTFIGSTLWTDCDKADPLKMMIARTAMNDYRRITHCDEFGNYRKLHPSDTVKMFVKSKRFIEESLVGVEKAVVVTHHGPSWWSIPDEYIGYDNNHCYVSDLHEFIMDRPQIRAWCHGHVHTACSYDIGTTTVHCNPRGYQPYEGDTGFDVNYSFEV
jgi:Icc-related predicted phosphoesterase